MAVVETEQPAALYQSGGSPFMDEEPTIEHNVPIPEEEHATGITHLLRQMKIGDSIVVNYSKSQGIASIAQRLGYKTTRRKVRPGWYRIWRTE
jgi:hypothetical protein